MQRRTRELLGEDGDEVIEFWLSVMRDHAERTSTRIEASKLLAERGWGRAPIDVESVNEQPEQDDARLTPSSLTKRMEAL